MLSSGTDGIQPNVPSKGIAFDEADSYQLIDQGLLAFTAGKVVVPNSRREELLKLFHDHVSGGFLGNHRTYLAIAFWYYWPHLRANVKAYVKSCTACTRRKITRHGKNKLMPILTDDFIFVA